MMPVSGPGSVVVVGAGIVGISAAYFLAAKGLEVTVLDAAVPASGATGASDGAVSVTSKRDPYLIRLAQAGVQMYRDLAAQGVLRDEFHPRPTYVIASSAGEADILRRHCKVLGAEGVIVDMLTPAEVDRELPMLAQLPVAAARVPGDGHAIGYKVVHRLAQVAGLRVLRNAKVNGLIATGGKVTGVRTGLGDVAADAVLVAAGSGTVDLLGLQKATRPRKGQLIITERGPASLARPAGPLMSSRYLASKTASAGDVAIGARTFGLVIDPLETGQFLVGGTREDDRVTTENDHTAVTRILSEAVALMPSLSGLRVLRTFSGVRLATADRLPIFGRVAGVKNLFVATGFEGDGISLGPLIGRAMQRLICGEEIGLDLSPLSAGRFDLTPRLV